MKTIRSKIKREPTEFARRVYDLLRQVPRGRVVSYGELARALGIASPRAVGQALRCNPYAPVVPCHRVIASDGRMGGFQGCRVGPALRRKLNLLAGEGVVFTNGRLKDASQFYRFGMTSHRRPITRLTGVDDKTRAIRPPPQPMSALRQLRGVKVSKPFSALQTLLNDRGRDSGRHSSGFRHARSRHVRARHIPHA